MRFYVYTVRLGKQKATIKVKHLYNLYYFASLTLKGNLLHQDLITVDLDWCTEAHDIISFQICPAHFKPVRRGQKKKSINSKITKTVLTLA